MRKQVLLILLLLLRPLFTLVAETPPSFDLMWGAKIPMRDGVRLHATVYRPQKQAVPLPVIFTLTPYTADRYHAEAAYFSTNDYIFVLVDARGRGSSEGAFTPFLQEAKDGHDVVEFLAKQPWCDGKVAMWGGSYGGYDQWATAKEFPSALKTIVPAAAAFPGVDLPHWKNIPYAYSMQWLTFTSGATSNERLFRDDAFWIAKFTDRFRTHRPFRELDAIVGNTTTLWRTWMEHPTPDAFWDAHNPTKEQFTRIDLPILTITGQYDADQPGALEFYRQHMRHGSAEARSKHYLLIGPWNHAGTRTPQTEFQGLKVGQASKLDMSALHKAWYDWTLKNGPRPELLKQRVAFYVTGSEVWKYAESLEGITTDKLVFRLDSVGGRANDVFQSGLLSMSTPSGATPDRYTYDPLDQRPAELESVPVADDIVYQRDAFNLFGNGLIYHSEPFAEAVTVAGVPTFTAWIALDVPDTDFRVTLHEIRDDGSSILLSQDQLRARYRHSPRQEELVRPGEIHRYVFSGFYFFARQIAQGSRLRLVLRCPNSIYWEKNYNSGLRVADETSKDARTARVALYHDAEHPSMLELPLLK